MQALAPRRTWAHIFFCQPPFLYGNISGLFMLDSEQPEDFGPKPPIPFENPYYRSVPIHQNSIHPRYKFRSIPMFTPRSQLSNPCQYQSKHSGRPILALKPFSVLLSEAVSKAISCHALGQRSDVTANDNTTRTPSFWHYRSASGTWLSQRPRVHERLCDERGSRVMIGTPGWLDMAIICCSCGSCCGCPVGLSSIAVPIDWLEGIMEGMPPAVA